MISLLELYKKDITEITDLQGRSGIFSGDLNHKIVSDIQFRVLRRYGNFGLNPISISQTEKLDILLIEYGWIEGALIRYASMTSNSDEVIPRVKFRLESVKTSMTIIRRNHLRPLGMVSFPADAKIFKPT